MWGGRVGGRSFFGSGQYTGNIMQGGVALQPQDYLLDGVTPLSRCIVVTGVATVAPDTTTGAAVFMAHNLVLIGAGASLSASTNCKGLCGYVNGRVALRGGAHLHVDKIGKAGNFGDLSPDMLLPAAFKCKIAARKLKAFVVRGEGADGAPGVTAQGTSLNTAGLTGAAAGPMQTGGGGSGMAGSDSGALVKSGNGGKGGPCGGGAASGSTYSTVSVTGHSAGPYGGPGGDGQIAADAGGGGDPPGSGYNRAQGAGGGLLMLFARHFDAASGCLVSADGTNGVPNQNDYRASAGTGGGCVLIATQTGGYSNAGTIRAAGGSGGFASVTQLRGGDGGPGSVNIFEIAA